MPKKARQYSKQAPFRDARLFVIIAEGEREDSYFKWFNARNSRINVHIIEREDNASAPKLFVNRLVMAQESGKFVLNDTDEVWFVCDVDKWRTQIEQLRIDCESVENWNVAVSNPCFEVWLHFHSDNPTFTKDTNCAKLKTSLPNSPLGQYNSATYCPNIERAALQARISDQSSNSFFPDVMQTKLYKLAEQMLSVLGNNWK